MPEFAGGGGDVEVDEEFVRIVSVLVVIRTEHLTSRAESVSHCHLVLSDLIIAIARVRGNSSLHYRYECFCTACSAVRRAQFAESLSPR
jgi:hypothetical protein